MADNDIRKEPLLSSFLHRPLPTSLEGLADLALDLRWNISSDSDRLWQMLDSDAWERTENPFMILQNVSQARLEEAAADVQFLEEFRRSLTERQQATDSPAWFARHANDALRSVAYFSMEFGVSEALPIYSGGLGLLAGDHLKTASDMGVPITGIGLLYQQGYFRQVLTTDGWQMEAFPYNDPTVLPVLPVHTQDGGWLRVPLQLPGRDVRLRLWQARVGRVNLYLLDSNDPLNDPWDRSITATLYPAESERRLIQEIALGVGGWRALEALSIEPEVCHLNEGHAAFVVLARATSFMRKTGQSLPAALMATRAGNVFTTHTAVAAGFDLFAPDLLRQHAQRLADLEGVSMDQLRTLAQQARAGQDDRFNVAFFAMRHSGAVNGVSRLHEQVSQQIFQPLFPRWPTHEVPVGYVTNGVHVPSWDAPAAQSLWERVCGAEGLLAGQADPCAAFDSVSDAELWKFRTEARHALVAYVRRRLGCQVLEHAGAPEAVQQAQGVLNPDALTLGFARRFTAYKRPNLLLHDAERLAHLLQNSDRPVQLIVAGKAHPADLEGKHMVQQMAQFAARPDLCAHVVFLEDYDIALMQQFAAGVDVWLNTPRRPWEASGTSGMKLLVNGGLNCSELDGWWPEAYTPEIGWALGDGQEHSEPDWDAREAEQLYALLEHNIIPSFYERDSNGIPNAWIGRVRASMSRLTPAFSSYRMLREYVEQVYLPAARAYQRRAANGAALAAELTAWQQQLDAHWQDVHFGAVRVNREGDSWRFEVDTICGGMNPESLRVELYAEPLPESPAAPTRMERLREIANSANGYVYGATVPASRPAEHYTPRVVPFHSEAQVPLEDARILWQR
jgi:starch phosphorylase